MSKHLITPPPELLEQWEAEVAHTTLDELSHVATKAARWGADQELEACCEWIYKLMDRGLEWSMDLRAARRPKPPSLKEQALEALKNIDDACESEGFSRSDDTDIIRRALESLPD